MIAQMSTKSNIYHSPGCGYLAGIRKEYATAFDMDDELLRKFQPCKHCCSLKTIYRDYMPDLKRVFEDIDIATEYAEECVNVHTNRYDWQIRLSARSQNLKLYQAQKDDESQTVVWGKCNDIDGTKEIDRLMQYIANQEKVAVYPLPYRKQALQIEGYALMNNVQIEYEGTDLYILTDIAAWKIAYGYHFNWFKLLHCPFDGTKLTMEQARTAHYHVQADVPKNQSPYKHLKYIVKHDEAKKIEAVDYRNLPQKTKQEKKYYRQAQNRDKRKSVDRVLNLFSQLEEKEKIQKMSFC